MMSGSLVRSGLGILWFMTMPKMIVVLMQMRLEFSTATFVAYLIFSYLLTTRFWISPVRCAIAYCIVRPSIIFFTYYIHITHDASHQIGSKSDISIKRVLSPSRLLTDISVGCVVKVLDVLEAER